MTDNAEILKEARERFRRCQEWESQARVNALFDAKFAEGDAVNLWQWDQAVRNTRNGRPCLTDNKVRQNNLLIVNDARQNKAQIKVTPTGGDATYEAAQIFSGIVRRIEYVSKAVDAYSTAIFHQVSTGIGYCRVITDYIDEESFDQDIYIRRVSDPNTIYVDPDAKDYDKADMRFAFVFEDIPRDRYEAEHGDGDMPANSTLDNATGWNDRDHIRTCEYWRRNDKTDKLLLLKGGAIVRQSALKDGQFAKIKDKIVDTRDIATPEVECWKITGDRIDSHQVWPGKYIPIVPFIGEETVIEGVMDRKGHTRSQIDPQRMLNYWASAAVEHVALQGKAPWVGDLRAFEGLENYWNTANTVNHAFLPHNGIDDLDRPVDPPTRPAPPEMPQAYIAGLAMAKDSIMQVTGQYQANLGAPSNETSGVAIERRQRAGDTATYHYIDNQAKGIRQIGRIILDLIPHIYDTARVTRIMGLDGTDSVVHLDPEAQAAHQHMLGDQPVTPEQADAAEADPDQPDPRVIFNPLVGRYDVEADVGPAFATRRQEAFNALSEIIKASPDLVHVAGDLLFKSADFPLADELAERLKRGVPPQFLGGPPVAVQQMQQHLQMQGQQAHDLLGKADAEIASLKQQLADKQAELQIKDYDSETKRLAAVGGIDPAALQLVVRGMVQDMLGTHLPGVLQAHAQLEQSMVPQEAPQDTGPDPMAMHQQSLDTARLGLEAQQQQHQQALDIAQHGLAVQQANRPQPNAAQ